MPEKKALEDLAWWLATYHPKYTLADVRPSQVPGYLETTKACRCTYPPFDGYTVLYRSGKVEPHYHTLDVSGYQFKGYGRSIYAFWRAIVRELQVNQGKAGRNT